MKHFAVFVVVLAAFSKVDAGTRTVNVEKDGRRSFVKISTKPGEIVKSPKGKISIRVGKKKYTFRKKKLRVATTIAPRSFTALNKLAPGDRVEFGRHERQVYLWKVVVVAEEPEEEPLLALPVGELKGVLLLEEKKLRTRYLLLPSKEQVTMRKLASAIKQKKYHSTYGPPRWVLSRRQYFDRRQFESWMLIRAGIMGASKVINGLSLPKEKQRPCKLSFATMKEVEILEAWRIAEHVKANGLEKTLKTHKEFMRQWPLVFGVD